MIEQRIHEFELVNEMLQAAMTVEGMDGDQQQAIGNEAAGTMAKLRDDLVKVREFEQKHGRMPSEAELAKHEELDIDPVTTDFLEATSNGDRTLSEEDPLSDSVLQIRTELEDSRAQVNALQAQLVELTSKLSDLGRSAQEESTKVGAAQEALRAEHTAKIEELLAAHGASIESLTAAHDAKFDDVMRNHTTEIEDLKRVHAKDSEHLRETYEEERGNLAKAHAVEHEALKLELQRMRSSHVEDASAKDIEVGGLKAQLKASKAKQPEERHTPTSERSATPSHPDELAELQARHQAAKQNAKSKYAKLAEDYNSRLSSAQAHFDTELAKVNSKLEMKESEVDAHQAEILRLREDNAALQGLEQEMDRQSQVISKLQEAASAKSEVESHITVLEEQLRSSQDDLKRSSDTLKSKSAELAQMTESLQASTTAHEAELETLQAQINAAERDMQQLKASHKVENDEALQGLEKELSAAQSTISETTSNHAKALEELNDRIRGVQEDARHEALAKEEALAESQKQLQETQNALTTTKESLERDLQKSVDISSAMRKELDELKLKHATDLQEAEARLKVQHEQEFNNLKATHDEASQKSEAALQSRYESELSSLKAKHEEALQDAVTVQKAMHEKEMKSLDETYGERVRQLAMQEKSALKGLEDYEANHVRQLEELKAQATSAEEEALERLQQEHSEQMRQLEFQLQSAQEELAASKSRIAEQLEVVTAQSRLGEENALKSLRDENAAQLDAVQSQLKAAHEEALESLKATHVEQLRQLDAQHKSTAAELDAAKWQVKSLKQIIQSAEQQVQSQQEEHAEALAKVEADLEASIIRHAENSSQKMELQMQHDQALQQAKDAARAEVEATSEAFKKQHNEVKEQELKEVRNAASAEMQNTIEALHKQHDQALRELKDSLEAERKKAIDNVEERHLGITTKSAAEAEARALQKFEQLQAASDMKMDELRAILITQHSARLEGAEQQHASHIDAITSEHMAALEAARAEHEGMTRKLQKELDEAQQAVSSAINPSTVQDLTSRLDDAQKATADLVQQHNETLNGLKEDHEADMQRMKAELNAAKKELSQAQGSTEIEELRSKLGQSELSLSTLATKHDATIEGLLKLREALSSVEADRGHQAAEIEDLKRETTKLRTVAEDAASKHETAIKDIAEKYEPLISRLMNELQEAHDVARTAEAVNDNEVETTLAEAFRTITQLNEQNMRFKEQLEGALLEVETQRNLADTARKAIDQSKQEETGLGNSVPPSPASAKKRKKRHSKKNSLSGLATSSNLGLESSKWAVEDGNGSISTPATPTATGSLRDGVGGTPTTPDFKASLKGRRNVGGQLAGIQEDIRQLDEISDDFLNEHERMARTLSRVGDRGTEGDVD